MSEDQENLNEILIETHLHDEACVISGRVKVIASHATVYAVLSTRLEEIARVVKEMGGIVGHIKASCTVKTVEMFSVTDTEVSVKKASEQEVNVNLAVIVFLISSQGAEALVRMALQAIRDIAVID